MTTQPEPQNIPVDIDGTPLNKPAIRHPGWSRNLLNQQLRSAWRARQPIKPYIPPAPKPATKQELALHAAFTRQGMTMPNFWTSQAVDVAYHLYGYRIPGYPYDSEPTLPERTPFTPSTPTGWDPRREHEATQRAITIIDPHALTFDDRGAAAIRILETLRETLGITIPDWTDIEQPRATEDK